MSVTATPISARAPTETVATKCLFSVIAIAATVMLALFAIGLYEIAAQILMPG